MTLNKFLLPGIIILLIIFIIVCVIYDNNTNINTNTNKDKELFNNVIANSNANSNVIANSNANSNASNNKKKTEKDNRFFTCYVKMTNVDPQFIDNYKTLNGKKAKCGLCENAILETQIDPCPTNNQGIVNGKCNQNIKIYSSMGIDIPFNKYITPDNIFNFFCLHP